MKYCFITPTGAASMKQMFSDRTLAREYQYGHSISFNALYITSCVNCFGDLKLDIFQALCVVQNFGFFPMHSIEVLPVFVCIVPRLEGRCLDGFVLHAFVLIDLILGLRAVLAFIASGIRSSTSGAKNLFLRTLAIKECLVWQVTCILFELLFRTRRASSSA